MTEAPVETDPDPRAVLRGMFGRDSMYLGLWGAQLILAAVFTPITTRLLGQTQFGETAAAIAVMQLLNALFGFALQTAVQRAHAGEGGEHHAQVLVSFATCLAIVLGVVAYLTGRWWCPALGLGDFPSTARYAVIWAAATATTTSGLGLIRSRDKLAWFATVSFTQSVFAEALALTLVVVHRTAASYVFGQMLAQLLAAALALAGSRPKLLLREHIRLIGSAMRFSAGLLPRVLAGFIVDAADRLVIHADLGANSLAHYTVARNIGNFASLILGLLDFVWLPRLFAIKDPVARRAVVATSRDGLYVLVVSAAIALTMASPLILWLWAPPSYHPQRLLLVTALVAVTSIPLADEIVHSQVLILGNRTGSVAAASITAAVLNLVLNLLLVPTLGITGSAAITLAGFTVYALMVRYMSRRDAPPMSGLGLVVAIGGAATCVGSAAIPGHGLFLGVRLILAVLAGMVFLLELLRLTDSPYLQRFGLAKRFRTSEPKTVPPSPDA
ncbi:MAG TPA: lipopolysaccharide biosynthesis protein [Mycobacterium sp.]